MGVNEYASEVYVLAVHARKWDMLDVDIARISNGGGVYVDVMLDDGVMFTELYAIDSEGVIDELMPPIAGRTPEQMARAFDAWCERLS